MEFLVAKSYQGLEVVEQPYTKEGGDRLYCKIRTKKGVVKEVRAYNEKEYARMYPAEARCTTVQQTSRKFKVKTVLGFQKGYIILLKGGRNEEEFCEKSNARFHRLFGWYIVSEEEVPENLPKGVNAVMLPWEYVGDKEGYLLSDQEVLEGVVRTKRGK